MGLDLKKLGFSAAASAVLSLLAFQTPAEANTLYFQINPNYDTSGSRQVFIFGAPDTTGSVVGPNGFNQAFDLGAAGFVTIDIPVADELGSNVIENKGFRVETAGAVSGYLLNRRSASTDMTYLIDSTSLGTDHVVAGYQNILPDQMSVQATQDNTVITFTPRTGSPVQVTLNAGETYMFAANSELTGSRVTSDKPIAVFSGNNCANVPSNNTACDHLLEQIPSVDVLSTTYLLAKTPRTGAAGNVVRVVATADNTEVRFNGDLVATLNSGEFYEGRVPAGLEIVATQKVLVAQYLIGSTQAGAVTDPAMVIIPGQDQWLDSYVFAAPSGAADFPTDFVSIVMATADIASLTINGLLADTSLFNPLGTTAFSFADFDVSGIAGPFAITAASPFLLLLSGFDSFDSYFTYGGARFSPGASPPPPPTDTDVYWDGDGNPNNGVVDGGDGVLTATSSNLTVPSGATNNTLPADPANIIFLRNPGVVTVDDSLGPIRIKGLEFRVSGYSIIGDPLTLGAAATILVDGDADSLATIDSVVQGSFGFTKTGPGRLVLNGINTYTGNTVISAGTLQGSATSFGGGDIAIGGTLIVDQAADATFANVLTGDGIFAKRGQARLILTGDSSFSGATTVEAGRLQVDGGLGGSIVTVNAGATLGGNGTVGGVNALAGSVVAPGASIGTLTVTGDYAQAAGSTYAVELTSTGQNDRLLIGGAATVATGATLNVTKLDAARYRLFQRYTVLTAAGGVTGDYSLTGDTTVSLFFSLLDSYDASNVYLDVAQTRSFASAAVTHNQVQAATGADHVTTGAVFEAIAYLQTAAQAQQAFDAISGEVHASARYASFEDSRFIREAAIDRLLATESRTGKVWGHAFGSWGTFDGDGNGATIDRDIGGFFIGADLLSTDSWRGGLVVGYSSGTIDVKHRASEADFEDLHLGAYVGFQRGPLGVRAGGAFMRRNLETDRFAEFSGFSNRLTADYDQTLVQIFGDAGYRFEFDPVALEPFVQLAYISMDADSGQENGGAAALTLQNRGIDLTVAQVGARVSGAFKLSGDETVRVRGSAAWRHASGDLFAPATMQLSGGPLFTEWAPAITEDALALDLSVEGHVAGTEVALSYSGQMGDGLSDHGVKATVRFEF